jgi:hypothetical protein
LFTKARPEKSKKSMAIIIVKVTETGKKMIVEFE